MNGFNNTGAITPNPNALNPLSLGQSLNSNPISTALNNAQSPNFQYSNGTTAYVAPNTTPAPMSNPHAVHSGLMSTVAKQGGSTTTTDTAGNTQTTKINPSPTNDQTGQTNPSDVVNKNAGLQTQGLNTSNSTNTSINGGINPFSAGPTVTGSFAPGSPQNTPPPVNTNPPPTPTPTSTPNTSGTTFPGLINSITGAGTTTQSEQNNTASQIATLRQNLQTDLGNVASAPFTDLNFQTGRINALQSQEAAKESALQGQLQSEIAAGTQNIGALTSAAGLSAPTPNTAYYGNPLTGGVAGQGADLMNAAVSQAVQLVKNGASPQDPSVQALLAPFGAIGQSAFTNAQGVSGSNNTSGNSGYNPTNATASANANAQNVGTAGTSNTQTAASGYASTLPAYQGASTAFTTADQQANNLLNTLSQTGINSSNATDYNTTINQLASKLGSTQTTAFTTALVEAQQSYTNLLASVGASTPTVNGEQATAVLSPSSTPAQIAEAIDKLNQAAYAKLAPQYQQALTYYNQLHGTNANAIPGYPPPTIPTPVSTTPPVGPDTSTGNIVQQGIGALVQVPESLFSSVAGFFSKLF